MMQMGILVFYGVELPAAVQHEYNQLDMDRFSDEFEQDGVDFIFLGSPPDETVYMAAGPSHLITFDLDDVMPFYPDRLSFSLVEAIATCFARPALAAIPTNFVDQLVLLAKSATWQVTIKVV